MICLKQLVIKLNKKKKTGNNFYGVRLKLLTPNNNN